ncbi:uncharacterized protein LOC144638846 [Oculina patagonica]
MAEVGKIKVHKKTSKDGVYPFVHDMIVEGKDAWLVDNQGRFGINWKTSPERYADYKSKDKNISKRKASNTLRSALLNFYEKEGAKEFRDGQKKNEKGEIIERQFQMPPRIFEELFGSDDGTEQETESIELEVCKSSQETPNSSSDTGFDEANMDIISFYDFFNISDPDDGLSYVTGGILTDGSLLDNTNSAEMDLDPPDITIPSFEIFNEEELKEPIGEICFEYPYNYNDQKKVAIYPLAGSIEGGLRFDITLTKTIPEDNTSERYLAEFDGACVVYLKKSNPTTLTGSTPSTLKPGHICVRVKTQAGKLLGLTDFCYVDHKTQEVLKRLYKDEALQSLYATLISQEQNDYNFALDQGSLIMHDQGKKQL